MLVILTAGELSAQDSVSSAKKTAVDRVAQLTLDTVATRLAALELKRPQLLVRGGPVSEEVRSADGERRILCEILRDLSGRQADAQAFAAARVVRAIEERLAGLAVERRLLTLRLAPGHEDIRAHAAVIGRLEQRRAELRSSGPLGVCAEQPPGQQ